MQSEYGDLYKVSLEFAGEAVSEVKVKYFDTITPCASICILKSGFLFAAAEFGNHALYQFQVPPAWRHARVLMRCRQCCAAGKSMVAPFLTHHSA